MTIHVNSSRECFHCRYQTMHMPQFQGFNTADQEPELPLMPGHIEQDCIRLENVSMNLVLRKFHMNHVSPYYIGVACPRTVMSA